MVNGQWLGMQNQRVRPPPRPSPLCLPSNNSPAVLKLEEGARDGRLAQFYLSLADKADKFLVVFAFIKLGLLEVNRRLFCFFFFFSLLLGRVPSLGLL